MRSFLIFITLFIYSCNPLSDSPSLTDEYGELYFTMDCVWRTHNDGETLWWCSQDVNTDLMTGHLALELLEDGRLSFCGEDLILNTGHELHDVLISSLTRGTFNCITTHDVEYGNEFDWIWYKDEKLLQIIWRPTEASRKEVTLIIDAGPPATTVEGKVYYKELI